MPPANNENRNPHHNLEGDLEGEEINENTQNQLPNAPSKSSSDLIKMLETENMGLHLKLDVLASNHKKEIDAKDLMHKKEMDAKDLEILDLKANRRQVLRENNFGMANTHMKFKKLVLKKVK